MLQGVTIVVESKQFTCSLLDFFNHCLYQDGNGKRLVWISLLDFPLPRRILILYAELYFNQIVRLHGVPRTIISDRGPQFTAHFWEQLHKMIGTNLVRSSAYHPQTSGQTERVNQILEDMLRACVISSKGSWEK